MSSVASANPSSGTAIAPGVLFRASAVAGAVAEASARRERRARARRHALGPRSRCFAAARRERDRVTLLRTRRLFVRAVGSIAPFLVAIALGGVVAWSGDATWASVLHVGTAATALAATLLVALRAFRGAPVPLASASDYLTLTKPRIMTLLLLTGAAGCSSAPRAFRLWACSS